MGPKTIISRKRTVKDVAVKVNEKDFDHQVMVRWHLEEMLISVHKKMAIKEQYKDFIC